MQQLKEFVDTGFVDTGFGKMELNHEEVKKMVATVQEMIKDLSKEMKNYLDKIQAHILHHMQLAGLSFPNTLFWYPLNL